MFAKYDLAGYGINNDIDGTMPRSCFSIFSTNGTFLKLHLLSHQSNSFHLDTQETWDLLSDAVKAIILGLHKDPTSCNLNDLGDSGVQVDGNLQVPVLLGKQPFLLQGILHEPVDLEKQVQVQMILRLTVPFGSSHCCSLLIPCLSLVPLPLPCFVYLENQSPWLPSSLQVTPSCLWLHLTLSLMISMEYSCLLSPLVGRYLLLPMPMGRSLLLPMTVSSYLHACFNAYGEESSAANAYVKLFAHAAFTSFHLDPSCYLPSTFVLAQTGSHLHEFVFAQAGSHLHGFIQLTSALLSGKTIGHQHPLFLHCIVMHSSQHDNGASEIPKCSKFFKTPNFIYPVLFYSMHGEQEVPDDLLVIAASYTMAKWISREMDAALLSTSAIQKHLCEIPFRRNGEHSFWHNEDHDLISCDMQATYLKHQVPLQDIHHVHFDLEDLSFHDFEEAIVLGNGSDAKTGSGSDDVLELIHMLPMKPCLPVVTRSLLVYHDDQFSKASKVIYAELFPEKVVGNNGKQESCALTAIGAIPKLSASRKSIPMDIKFSASVSHAHPFGKHMSVDSIAGEQFSAVYGCHKLAEHTVLVSFQFDPGGLLLRGFVFDPGGFMRFLKSFPATHILSCSIG